MDNYLSYKERLEISKRKSLDDLAFAEEVFKGDYTPTSVTDPTLAVVYGLYARTYLWLGGFELNFL